MASSDQDPERSVELVLYRSAPPRYSASSLADLARIHPEMVLCYWRLGLLRAEVDRQDPLFDDDALFVLKRLEELRKEYNLSLRALRLLAEALRAHEG